MHDGPINPLVTINANVYASIKQSIPEQNKNIGDEPTTHISCWNQVMGLLSTIFIMTKKY